MGYDEAEAGTVWALDFEQYPGLTVRMRRPGFAAERLLARADRVLADGAADRARKMDAFAGIFTALADSMESWTLTRNGRPVPVTRADVLACDGLMLSRIVGAWRTHAFAPQTQPRRPERGSVGDRPAFDDRLMRDLPMVPLADELDTDVATAGDALHGGPELGAVADD